MTPREYRQTITEVFSSLKNIHDADELQMASLPLPDGVGSLIPLCALNEADEDIIGDLARWRELNSHAFPTRFPVTLEGTSVWIRKGIMEERDRILFLIENHEGLRIGHMGYFRCLDEAGTMEIDNVVRGVKHLSHGIMGSAMRTLVDWGIDRFSPRTVMLRVLSDNQHAIDFYQRCGFREDRLIPLRRHVEDDRTAFRPLDPGDNAPPDKHLVRMVFSPTD